MAAYTGFAGTGTAALMNELARRQQAQKEEQDRQRQYQQVKAMFQGMGLNVPDANMSMDAAVPVANYQLGQQQQTREDAAKARQNQVIRSFLGNQFPDLMQQIPPDADLGGPMTQFITDFGKRQQQDAQRQTMERQMHEYAAQIGVQGHENLSGEMLGMAIENRLKEMQSDKSFNQDMSQINAIGERDRQTAQYRYDLENPAMPQASDEQITPFVSYIRGVHGNARNIQQLMQMTSDPDYKAAMAQIEEWDRNYWRQLQGEYMTLKNRLSGYSR